MHARSKQAGTLIPGDLIDVEHDRHQHGEGALHCGDWCVESAVVDTPAVTVNVTPSKTEVAVGWHDPHRPTCCGVMVVGTRTPIPYHGHLKVAA